MLVSLLITIVGLENMPNIKEGDDLAKIIVESAGKQNFKLQDRDVVVVTQKIVSKAEGRVVELDSVKPSKLALRVARRAGKDPRHIETILRETVEILKMRDAHLIVETKHGFVCANAGVDRSNVVGGNQAALLPLDPDRSARLIRDGIKALAGVDVAVIVSDTFGRPWRVGQTNVAIGIAGMKPIRDYRGQKDMFGYMLRVSLVAVADELASAAELVMNKFDRVPVAVVRGYSYIEGEGTVREILRPKELDLFR